MDWVKYVLESEIKRLNNCKNLSLKKLQNPQLEDAHVKHENGTIEDCDNKIKEISDFLNKNSDTWISIDKELPKEGQIVLAYGSSVMYCIFERGNFYRHIDRGFNDRTVDFYYNNITHWQSIPEKNNELNPRIYTDSKSDIDGNVWLD
jgi:hypothetical protein